MRVARLKPLTKTRMKTMEGIPKRRAWLHSGGRRRRLGRLFRIMSRWMRLLASLGRGMECRFCGNVWTKCGKKLA